VTADIFLFWFLAIITLMSGLAVVTLTNPVYSALCLAMTMVGVAALFVTLGAHFLAGVQIIVYAGAVMVLFVMVLMLFDLKKEKKAFSVGALSGFFKLVSVGALAGLVVGSIALTSHQVNFMMNKSTGIPANDSTQTIGHLLFTKYIFQFEALGILLLVIAIGVVALARSKGGTHAQR
jgi:NADH-quinone oxidoreductase subunit J